MGPGKEDIFLSAFISYTLQDQLSFSAAVSSVHKDLNSQSGFSLNPVPVSQQGSRCVWFPKRNGATDDLSLALSTYMYTAPCAEHIPILRYILR